MSAPHLRVDATIVSSPGQQVFAISRTLALAGVPSRAASVVEDSSDPALSWQIGGAMSLWSIPSAEAPHRQKVAACACQPDCQVYNSPGDQDGHQSSHRPVQLL